MGLVSPHTVPGATQMAEVPIPQVGDGTGIEESQRFLAEELQLALRNKAIPLEGLRWDITPTGMHYLLVHYDIPMVDATDWRLQVGGLVRSPLTLTLPELQQLPQRSLPVTLECAGDGRGLLYPRPISQPWLYGGVATAEWTGTVLRGVLERAGLGDGVREILFTALDRGFEGGQEQVYQRSLPVDAALHEDVLLAWAMNGAPLEPQHGFPLRLVVPGWYGMAHVKWLGAIEVIDTSFEGYQQAAAYRYSQTRSEPGDAVTVMRVRSLMVPPGIPDFLTRTRIVERGSVDLFGRAWSGVAPITHVDVSTDGGANWDDARLDAPIGHHAWRSWHYTWQAAEPGSYELCCRATDAEAHTQPVDQRWTAGGMGNNTVHRVRVIVR